MSRSQAQAVLRTTGAHFTDEKDVPAHYEYMIINLFRIGTPSPSRPIKEPPSKEVLYRRDPFSNPSVRQDIGVLQR